MSTTMTLRGRGSVAGLLLLFASLSTTAASTTQELLVSTLGGERVDLLERIDDGRWTLVLFWTLDCVPCEEQKPMLDEFHRTHQAVGVAGVIGLALDGPAASAAIRQRMRENGTSFPTLVAFDDVFPAQYAAFVGGGFRATPTYWLFDPDGRLAGTHVGKIERTALDEAVAGTGR